MAQSISVVAPNRTAFLRYSSLGDTKLQEYVCTGKQIARRHHYLGFMNVVFVFGWMQNHSCRWCPYVKSGAVSGRQFRALRQPASVASMRPVTRMAISECLDD